MKKFVIALLIGLMTVTAFAGQTEMFVSGDINDWAAASMTKQTLGTWTWKYTVENTDPTGNSNFLFRNSAANWDNKWAPGFTGSAFSTETLKDWNKSWDDGTINAVNGKYYTFIFKDVETAENSEGYVFETSAAPVTISSVSQNPITTEVTPDDDVVVTVTVSASPSAEEDIFVRYTTDAWSTSSVVECSFTGTSGTATIPKQANETAVAYYVFTTTIDAPNTASDNIDLMTINYDNNGGDNYSYTSSDLATPITLTSFTAVCREGAVVLEWETESETNNASFIIYRDGTPITSLPGAGTTSETHNYTFTDTNVIPGSTYTYVLADMTLANVETRFDDEAVTVTVEGSEVDLLNDYAIGAAYPNPFNPGTVVPVRLNTEASVRMTLYDLTGREIREIANETLAAGSYSYRVSGSGLSTGIYLLQTTVNGRSSMQKIALMK